MNKKKIRVLEAIRQGLIGGGETHVLELVSKMDKEVFQPLVLSFTDGAMVDSLKSLGIPVYVINSEKAFDWTVWKKVKKLIIDEQIDLVHAHGTRANSNVFWAATTLKIPLLYTVHGWSFHPDQTFLKRRLRELSEKFLTSKATTTICVSQSNQSDGVNRFSMKRSTIINNGIDTEKFNPNGVFKNIRQEYGIQSDKTLIGFFVRMTLQKDPLTVIRAMKLISEQTKDIVLLMVGEGDLKSEAVALAKNLNLTKETLIFDNFRQDVPDLLHAIDIYCLPSLWEGLPIGLLEAMAMQKVVIASPIDGTKEAIIDGMNGIHVQVGNPQKLADVILSIHKNKELQKKLSENAIKTIYEKFTLDVMVRNIENQYKLTLKTR